MKNRKIKIMAGLGVALIASYSIPATLYINSKLQNSYVVFHSEDKSTKKSKSDMEYLLKGENSSENAQLIELAFYKNALYGFNFENNEQDQIIKQNPTKSSIIGKYPGLLSETNKINTFYNDFHKAYTLVSIYNETWTTYNGSINSFLANEVKNDNSLYLSCGSTLTNGSQYDFLRDWISDEGNGSLDNFLNNDECFNAIDMDLTRDLNANKFIFQTIYLFQKSTNNSYDYKITEKLKQQQLMLVWSATLYNIDQLGNDGWDLSIFNDEQTYNSINKINQYYVNGTNGSTTNNIDVNEFKVMGGDIGYQGIISKSSSSLPVKDSFWDWNKSWNINAGSDSNGWTTLSKGTFSNSSANGSWYKENTLTNNVVNTSSTSEGYVLRAKSVYPFIFAYNYIPEQQHADKFYYSIFANEKDGTYYNPSEEIQDSNKISLIDVLFNPTTQLQRVTIATYIIDSVISNSSSNLLNSQQFWRNKGYYIELSGEMKTIYGSLIDSGIQKVE